MAKTILTVDDSPSMRMLLRAALPDLGYEIEEAEDGIDALEKLEGLAPDLMLTDINMPRMDGFGVIEGVRAAPSHRATPILVLTPESDATKKERARAAGATGWIVKPFNPTKLVDASRRVAA